MTNQTGNELLSTGSNNYLLANELFLIDEMKILGVDSVNNAPPGSPVDHDSRLILTSPTGDFTGHSNELAIYYDSTWLFAEPVTDMSVWIKSLSCYYKYTGSAWQEENGWAALTDGASIQVNAVNGPNYGVTLSGNRTLINPTNLSSVNNDGKIFRFRIQQDGTGSRTLSYQSLYKFPSATPPTLSTASGAVDLLEFIYHKSSNTLMFRGGELDIS